MAFNFQQSNFSTPASSAPAFGGFGTTNTAATKAPFGGTGFGFSASTATPGFGQAAAPAGATPGFGFGATTATTSSTGFGFGTTTSTPSSGFGSFGSAPVSSAPGFSFGSFGAGTTTSTAGNTGGTLFSGFGGQQTQTQPQTSTAGFGGLGSFGAKPLGSGTSSFGGFGTAGTSFGTAATSFGSSGTGFGGTGTGFGTTGSAFGATGSAFGGTGSAFGGAGSAFGGTGSAFGTTGRFGQQQQQQAQQPNQHEALYNALVNVNIFGDERDTTLTRWNQLQAVWGTGYYSANAPPVEFTPNNPFCRFKAVGYSVKLTADNKEGLVAINFNKKESELRPEQNQLITKLSQLLGNKPNLTVNVAGIKPLSESKSQVVITVQEKGATGSVHKIPATELATFLLQPTQRQHLVTLGVDNVYPQVALDEDQLKDYYENPPSGIDPRLWKQAIQDNPNPDKFIPVPMIGFKEVRWRMQCQEQETALHQAFLDKVAEEVQTLQRKQAATVAKTTEYRRKLVELEHRLLQLLVKQEITRKVGLALTPEEEAIRSHLESLQPHMYAPTHLKGRLAELLSTIRMQREKGEQKEPERYTMDPTVQDDIKQFLRMQQDGMQHLVQTIQQDLADLKIIKEGMIKLLHRQ
ncbi:putative nucleoporin Nup54 [Frankliniella fusca]|uniref:Nucleoporin Nup54 n=1 Tax=Frankliniella fusca TaxID=407009 RepID=A0AAE1H251_9NEOP|nr:putative nucleoporin Nup54 [Frankliniella fusca]